MFGCGLFISLPLGQYSQPDDNPHYIFNPYITTMRQLLHRLSTAMLAIGLSVTCLQAQQTEKQPAFPGAEGYGRYVTGGRGGAVYHVTSLADDGSAGTLRWALGQNGTKTIVFDVSGTIHLNSELSVSKGNVTIAGQTAPGDGICVADYPMSLKSNSIIVRYMRFRLGNKHVTENGADGWDGFGGFDHRDWMIDHCSVSWSIDECLSVLGNVNTTVQWCIVSHSLVNSGHSKGAHGYGGNWGGDHASFHHNLMAHHVSREPRLGPRPTTQLREHMDMRNNVFYNWAGNGCYGGEGMNVNIVNNYYKPGPATMTRNARIQKRIAAIGVRTNEYVTTYPDYAPALHLWGKLYVTGNYNPKHSDVSNDNWTYGIYDQIDASGNDGTYTSVTKDTIRLSEPLALTVTTTHTARQAYERVLNYAGCSLSRDSYDAEIVSDTRNGEASHKGSGLESGQINSQDDLKPAGAGSDWSAWPTLHSTQAPLDTDGDGMPDEWETSHGLNPNDANDGKQIASDGYTYLEHYLNALVADITTAQNEGGSIEGEMEYVSDQPVQTYEWEVSAQTSNGDWTFGSGDGMLRFNEGGTPATGGSYYIKFSRNHDYKAIIPEGVEIYKVKVDGYLNVDSGTGYIQRLGNNNYTADQYPLISRKEADHIREYTIELEQPGTGSMVLRNSGDGQACLRYYLYGRTASGIHTVNDDVQATQVFSIDGRRIQPAASHRQQGIFVINGQKTLNR